MNKKSYIISVIFIVIVSVIFIRFFDDNLSTSIPSNKVKVYSDNVEPNKWNEAVTIVVDTIEVSAKKYSFDGGKKWQNSNRYVATENGKYQILIKDSKGNISQPVMYEVNSIDVTPPIISVSLPSEVMIGEHIDLKEYVTVSDDVSGYDGELSVIPSQLDTSTAGDYSINYNAKDKAGNEKSVTVNIKVVMEKNKKHDVIMYRYRTKIIDTSNCGTYDCSHYSDDYVAPSETSISTGKCNDSYNRLMRFNSSCYITPTDYQKNCLQVITDIFRYTKYGNNVIDIIALNMDGNQVENIYSSRPSKGDEMIKDKTGTKTDNEFIEQNSQYKSAPCGNNEIEIDGYCHAICSKITTACPNEYSMVDNVCRKYISKTCYNKCDNFVWSEWSAWSEVSIVATDDMEVETKIVTK